LILKKKYRAILLKENESKTLLNITSFIACVWLFGYYTYQEIYPEILRKHLEEEQVIARFNGDKDKIRRYHGFKKHFDGELTLEQLEKWFLHLDKHH